MVILKRVSHPSNYSSFLNKASSASKLAAVLVVLCIFFHNVRGQTSTLNISPTLESISTPLDPLTINSIEMEMCLENDTVSSQYCNCKNNVISCDFTGFLGSMKNRTSITIHGYQIEPTVKRLCLCNTPNWVLLNLTSSFVPNQDSLIHRTDISNLEGPLRLHEAFSVNLNGDLYMSNVSNLSTLHSFEFGRGNDMNIEDVENLECCSKIKSSLVFSKPTLYMENIAINRVESRSIGGLHLWKTVVLKSIVVNDIMQFGMEITTGVNVSITDCNFKNVADNGINIKNFENLLFAKNSIGYDSPYVFVARSKKPNSTIMNLENYFDTPIIWDLDASQIINWFNYYYSWNDYTFLFLNRTNFPNRTVSIEFNAIEHHFMNDTSDISKISPEENLIFNENILDGCNCSILIGNTLPNYLNDGSSRCNINIKNQTCLIDYKSVLNECTKNPTIPTSNILQMCNNPSLAVFQNKLEKAKPKISGQQMMNPFLLEMMKNVKFSSKLNRFFLNEVEVIDTNTTEKSTGGLSPTSSESHNVTLYIFLPLIGVIFVILILGYLFKRKRNSMYRQPLGSSYDVLTTAT